MANRQDTHATDECTTVPQEQATKMSAMSQFTLKPVSVMQKKKKSEIKKTSKRRPPIKREKMHEGELIQSEMFTWKTVKLLGAGGFGDVYKVAKVNNLDKEEYAMKTEVIGGDKRMLRLKVEVTAMKQCLDEPNPDLKRHFVALIDRGITTKFKFLVMELVGPSLEDIRRQYLGRNFSRSTSMTVAIQSLQAISDFHYIGWLHRDIKPANFAAGLGEKERIVYLLDFGIAKKIFKPGGREVVLARSKVKFLGTLRFASRACHLELDQGRKDDVETWIYMVFDLLDYSEGLPWKKMRDKKQVAAAKERFFIQYTYNKVFKEFGNILKQVNELTYKDEPKYKEIEKELRSMCKINKVNPDRKPDWIGRLNRKKGDSSSSSDTSSDNRQSGSEDSSTSEQKPKRAEPPKKAGKNKEEAKGKMETKKVEAGKKGKEGPKKSKDEPPSHMAVSKNHK